MSYDLNHVTLTANLCFDPEIRVTPNGHQLANLRLAFNKSLKQGDGYEERPCFVSATLWAGNARYAEQYLHKGDRIVIDGRLDFESWVDASGQTRSKVLLAGQRVFILNRRNSEAGGSERAPEAGEAAPAGTQAPTSAGDEEVPF